MKLYLKALRRDKRLTQKQLAAMLNIDQARISRIESGKQRLTIDQVDYLREKFPDNALMPNELCGLRENR